MDAALIPHIDARPLADQLKTFGDRHFLTTRDIFQEFLDLAIRLLKCEVGYLHGFKPDSDEIQLNVWGSGVYQRCTAVNDSHYPISKAGIWADSSRQNETIIHNVYKEVASSEGLPEGHFELVNHMSAPLHEKGVIVAVIGVGNKTGGFSNDDRLELERLIKLGWPMVLDRLNEHGRRARTQSLTYNHRNPQDVLKAMVKTVSKALELRDEYTSHHQSNVANLSEGIAELMKLPKEQRFGIHLSALVHDVGKIAIPSQILAKPGKLNPAEIALVQMHPSLGAEIFDDVDLPWPIVDIILQHHERMDGSGYPDGLVGESICLEARIIAVADTYDAMASDRPYRHAPGKEAAVGVLAGGRGSQFDTDFVDAFLSMIKNNDSVIENRGQRYSG